MAILKTDIGTNRKEYSGNLYAYLLCFIAMLVSQDLLAEDSMTIQEIEQKEETDKVLEMINSAENILMHMDKKWNLDCTKAIGYEPFCSCIGKEIPSSWSFSNYIAITVKSKEENQYKMLDEEHKRAYDLVFKVRDDCVRIINEKP